MEILASLIIPWLFWVPLLDAGAPQDYCMFEKFNASCPEGQVIMMTSAAYGRMRVGRCIKADYLTGCVANVLDHVDEMCSGRQKCTIDIPDRTLSEIQPCRKDLVAYFEASYDCVKVINPLVEKKTYCGGMLDISKHKQGYIASSVTAETSLGSKDCPWQIIASRGQRINITLYDFSAHSASLPARRAGSKVKVIAPRNCPTHAMLVEEGDLSGKTVTRNVDICSQLERRRWVYTTTSNSLWIKIINVTQARARDIKFLLHYEVIGCADIKPLAHAKVERKDESLKISCNYSQETWNLVCKGTDWIGDYHNCSSARNKMARGNSPEEEQGFPLGLLIAIAIGVVVGVVLGFVFLIAIFVCRRRVRQEGKHDSGNPLMGGAPVDSDQQNIYRLVEVRPPASMMCDCQYTPGPDHKSLGSIDNTLLMQSSPGECIYRTTPRVDHGECHYQSRDGDTYQPQNITPLKTCDIISDIHVPDSLPCCEGPDWYTNKQQCMRAPGDTYPRIAPFPGFNRSERGSNPRNQMPSSQDSGNVADIYEPTSAASNTSTFQTT